MSDQLMILPTGEALRAHGNTFIELQTKGCIPLAILATYLLDLILGGDSRHLNPDELNAGFCHYLVDTDQMTDYLARFLCTPAFIAAFYALYEVMQNLQELLLTAPKDQPSLCITGVSYAGWSGDDMLLRRDLQSFSSDYADVIRKWG